MFIDLRDRYGLTQLHIDPAKTDIYARAEELKQEYVLKIIGTVRPRPEGQTNKDMVTGEIEVEVESLEVLSKSKTLPFNLGDDPKTSEENRFKHRYLDLRRRKVLENIEFRARMNHFTRNWFTESGFLEVQTPLFTVSSPEGARDYLIPSRVNPGKFYALPQAPQQYKQLLMIGGADKYFQIAPCFRDEDPRADRHSCEFYQVDVEMSFVHQEDIWAVGEKYVRDLCSALTPHKQITVDCIKIPYVEAMDKYGSDKPDLRFGLEFVDVSSVVATSQFSVFTDAVAQGGIVKAIRLPGQLMTRKEIDQITETAKQAGAGWLAYLMQEGEEIKWSIAKFFSPEELQTLAQATQLQAGDMLFFAAGHKDTVHKVLNKIRLYLRDTYNLAHPDHLAFCRVTNFPFYERDEVTGKLDFVHNPFSIVTGWKEALETQDPLDIVSQQYDMVCNGYEILSGSVRNHEVDVLVKAFELVWKWEADVKRKFGAMYEAFQYGVPPHGGFAFGFDRLLMILKDEPNIREIYAFPKSGRAEDVMMGAPSIIEKEQLDELFVASIATEEAKE